MRKFDYLTFGRDVEFFGNLFTQTLPVLISLVIGSAPILFLPLSELSQSLLFGIVALFLLIALFLTVSWISNQTYSIVLRNVKARLISVCAYSVLGGVIVFCGYYAFITPYPHPEFALPDVLLGTVYSLLYAELAAIGLVTTIKSESQNRITEEIQEFLELSEKMEQGTTEVGEDTAERMVQLARSIEQSINDEPASGSKKVADRLSTWVAEFENEDDFVGREKLVGSDEFSELANDLCTLS